jgi:hypothetical protein
VNLENSLARFKKRKWGSEKPRKTESEAPPTESEAPPTESEAPPTESEAPPTESEAPPAETFEDKSATKKLTDRLFWMRIVFSVVGGIIATFAFEDIVDVEEKRWTSIGFMIMLFIATAIIAKSWRIRIANRKKYVTTGIGSFVFLYLFTWIVSHTLTQTTTSPSIIPFP